MVPVEPKALMSTVEGSFGSANFMVRYLFSMPSLVNWAAGIRDGGKANQKMCRFEESKAT